MSVINEADIKDMWEDNEKYLSEKDQSGSLQSNKEFDPAGKSAKEPGSKLDAGKSPIFAGLIDYFPLACRAVANVSDVGARKYTWKGWESVPNGFIRYSDALVRHLVSASIEGPVDIETNLDHAAQVAWNAMARLELYLREQDAVHRS